MQYLKLSLIATALIASVSTYTFAGDRGDRIIDRLDTDGDNRISLDEFHPPGSDRHRGHGLLERADLNDDGEVTVQEALQASSERMAERQKELEAKLAELDSDGDGIITELEIRERAFNRLDEDNDGFLSAEEFKHHRRMRHHLQERRHHASG